MAEQFTCLFLRGFMEPELHPAHLHRLPVCRRGNVKQIVEKRGFLKFSLDLLNSYMEKQLLLRLLCAHSELKAVDDVTSFSSVPVADQQQIVAGATTESNLQDPNMFTEGAGSQLGK